MKDKLIKELEEAKLQTSKEWLDGFNKGIDRAIELTEANREEEPERDIPTVPSYVAKEIENIPNTTDEWDLVGYASYLDGEGLINITDNRDVHRWAKDNPKLFLQLLGGIVYKVSPEVETVDLAPRNIDWGEVKAQRPVVF